MEPWVGPEGSNPPCPYLLPVKLERGNRRLPFFLDNAT